MSDAPCPFYDNGKHRFTACVDGGIDVETVFCQCGALNPDEKPLTMTTAEREKLIDWAHDDE